MKMPKIDPPVMTDLVQHPAHYTQQVPGIECIQVTQHFNFNRGNIIKLAWRCGDKGDPIMDLRKIIEYANFEIKRIQEKNTRVPISNEEY